MINALDDNNKMFGYKPPEKTPDLERATVAFGSVYI